MSVLIDAQGSTRFVQHGDAIFELRVKQSLRLRLGIDS